MQIWERNAGWECDAGSGTRRGFWSAMRHATSLQTPSPPAESREHTPWGQSLAQGDQTVVRQVLDGVGAVLVAELVGNCIGHVGMVLVGYYDRLIASPHLGC